MTKRSRTRCTRRSRLAKDDGGEEDGQARTPRRIDRFGLPQKTDVRSAPLTRTLPSPCTGLLWRINIKSSPWYPYCIIRRRLRPTEGRQATKTVIWRNSISSVPHLPGYREFQRNNCRCDAGLPPIRPRKRHSIRRDPHKLSISLAPKFNLPSGLSFPEKTKSEGYREPAIGVLAVPVSGMEL